MATGICRSSSTPTRRWTTSSAWRRSPSRPALTRTQRPRAPRRIAVNYCRFPFARRPQTEKWNRVCHVLLCVLLSSERTQSGSHSACSFASSRTLIGLKPVKADRWRLIYSLGSSAGAACCAAIGLKTANCGRGGLRIVVAEPARWP